MKEEFKKLLSGNQSKLKTSRIVRMVGDDQKKFDDLISLCFSDDDRLAQCASWPACLCVEQYPHLAKKHLGKIISQLKLPRHNSIRRNFTKLLTFVEIPASREAEAISILFDLLNRRDEFVAVKVYSMEVLENFCRKYHELSDELIASLESQFDYQTAAFRSRAKWIIKRLKY